VLYVAIKEEAGPVDPEVEFAVDCLLFPSTEQYNCSNGTILDRYLDTFDGVV
jgi:hypothetical protein